MYTRPAVKYALSGNDLLQQRLACDVTQTAIAEHMGVDQSRVCRVERQRVVEATTARRYLAACREAERSAHERAQVAVEKARVEEREREAQRRQEAWMEEATARAAALEPERKAPAPDPDPVVMVVSGIPIRASLRPIVPARRRRHW